MVLRAPSRCPALLALAVLALVLAPSSALKLKLDAYSTQCVAEVADFEGDRVMGSFVGSATGGYRYFRNFFDLEIKMEDGTSLYTARSRQDAKFDFVVPRAGRFNACIRNYGRQPAEVTYSSYVGHKVEHDKVTQDQLTPVRDAVFKMRQTLRSVLEEQRYQEHRDKALMALNESSRKRTTFWAVMEALVLVTVSVGQVFLLKRLFEGQAGSRLPKSSFSMQPSRLQRPQWGV